MKRIGLLGAMLLCVATSSLTATPSVVYHVQGGSKTSGFKVASSGSLAVTGTLIARDLTIEAPSVGEIPAFTLDRTTVVLTPSNDADATMFYGTGALADNGNITLNSANDRLVLEKGTTTGTITVSQNATIEGFGYFGGAISVADTKTLTFAVPSLNVNVTGLGTLLIETDVVCSDDVTTLPSAVNGNGYTISFGQSHSDITLAGTTAFTDGSINLAGRVTLDATYTPTDVLSITGNGGLLSFNTGALTVGSGVLYLSDITLADLVSSGLSANTDGSVRFSNVLYRGADQNVMMTINAAGRASSSYAAVTPTSSGSMGNVWRTGLTWTNGATLDLHSPVALGSVGATRTWTMSNDSEINGNGNVIDLTYGTFSIANGKTLTITDAIITGFRSTSFTFGNSSSNLILQGCTIVLDQTVNLTDTAKFTMQGANTIVTGGSYELTFNTNAYLVVMNGTTCYDTQGAGDTQQVNGANIDTSTRGRLAPIGFDGSLDIAISSDYSLATSKFLYPEISGVNGSTITFTDNATLDGNGRTLFFAETSSITDHVMFTVNATKTAITKNIVLEGAACSAFDIDGTLKFGNGTVIKLKNNDTLASLTYKIGAANSDSVTLDLGGNDLTFGTDGIIALQNEDYSGLTLRIMNGRLVNVNSSSFTATSTGATERATVILQDVDVVLSDDLTSAKINWEIMGNCTLSGAGAYKAFTDANTASGSFKIHSGAHLTVTNGMTLAFSSAAHANAINLVDRTSVLELIGGTLSSSLSSSLVLTKGNLVADHASTLSGNITLGGATTDALYIDIMPGAQVNVAGGTLTYANSDSAS